MTVYKAIKLNKDMYESLKEIKKVIIQNGIDSFPKEFIEYLKKNNYDLSNLSMGNLVKLTDLTVRYLIGA